MKKYKIKTTSGFREDIRSHSDYIKYRLRNKTAAERLFNDTEKSISELSYSPQRYAIRDFGNRTNLGIRTMILRKYKIYYFIKEDEQIVEVLRMLHERQEELATLLVDDNIYPKYLNEEEAEYEVDSYYNLVHGGIERRSSADLRSNYSVISALANDNNRHVVITKNGKDDVVIISNDEFDRIKSIL